MKSKMSKSKLVKEYCQSGRKVKEKSSMGRESTNENCGEHEVQKHKL